MSPSNLNNAHQLQQAPRTNAASGEHGVISSPSPPGTTLDSSAPTNDRKRRFRGVVDFSTIMSEDDRDVDMSTTSDAGIDIEDSSMLSTIAPERIQQGAEVLALLRDMPIYERFTNRCASHEWFATFQPIMRIWIDEFWRECGRIVQQSKRKELRGLSERVFRNTRQPMQIHGRMTATEWAKAATGRNLRWEVVGAILSMTGVAAASISNWDSTFDDIRDSYIDRASFTERMKSASDFCLLACNECEIMNDTYASYMLGDLGLLQAVKGDAHYVVWQRAGEVCDIIVALGYHQDSYKLDVPFFLQQMRRKMFIMAYAHDKLLATLLGRPPRLSNRYCNMDMPVALSDTELMSEGTDLQHALSRLDANGGDRSSDTNSMVWLRVLFQHCMVKEDILALVLGQHTNSDQLVQRTDYIREQIKNLYAEVPANIDRPSDYNKTAPQFSRPQMDASREPIRDIFAMYLHSSTLHTKFLVERVLITKLKLDTTPIISLARDMLSLVLRTHEQREKFHDFRGHIVHMLAMHGLPSAGVLAIELLKQEQSRSYTQDILPRSKVIQDLSVFISALGTVQPGEVRYAVCAQGQRGLKRLMDQILSPHRPVQTTAGSAGGSQAEKNRTSLDNAYFAAGSDAEFLQWLDNVDWDILLDVASDAGPESHPSIATN